MSLRAMSGAMTFALVTALSGLAAAQDTRPDDTAPKPAEPAPQPTDPTAQPAPAQAPTPPPSPAEPALAPPPPPEVAMQPPAEAPVVAPEPGARFIFDAALGYTTGGAVKHPDLSGKNFSGEMLELGVGAELNPKLQFVVAFTSFMTTLERIGNSKNFAQARIGSQSGVHPLADCTSCSSNGGTGGLLVKTPLHVHTLGPRFDYLPLGSTGPYVGVTAGVAIMQDLDFRGGAAGAARIGYELRAFSAMGVSLEAGAHAQVYSDSSAILPYAAIGLTMLDPFSSFSPAPAQKTGTKASPTRL